MTSPVRLVACNVLGAPVGEGHWLASQPDVVVTKAKAMRAAGTAWLVIAAELGVPKRTVRDWCAGRRRYAEVVRFKVKRVAT